MAIFPSQKAHGRHVALGSALISKPIEIQGELITPHPEPWNLQNSGRLSLNEKILAMICRSRVAFEGWMHLCQRMQQASMAVVGDSQQKLSADGTPKDLSDDVVLATTTLLNAAQNVSLTTQCALTFGCLDTRAQSAEAQTVLESIKLCIQRLEKAYENCRNTFLSISNSDSMKKIFSFSNEQRDLNIDSWYYDEPEVLVATMMQNCTSSGNLMKPQLRQLKLVLETLRTCIEDVALWKIHDAIKAVSHSTLDNWKIPEMSKTFPDFPLLPALSPWYFQRCYWPFSSWFELHSKAPLKAHMEISKTLNGTYLALGSGWGCAPLYAKTIFGVKAIGYEPITPYLHTSRHIVKTIAKCVPSMSEIEFRDIDPLEVDLSEGTVVLLSFQPGLNAPVTRARMIAKILTEVKVGAVVIDTSDSLETGIMKNYFRLIQKSVIPMPFDISQSFYVYQRVKPWEEGNAATIISMMQRIGIRSLRENVQLLPETAMLNVQSMDEMFQQEVEAQMEANR